MIERYKVDFLCFVTYLFLFAGYNSLVIDYVVNMKKYYGCYNAS